MTKVQRSIAAIPSAQISATCHTFAVLRKCRRYIFICVNQKNCILNIKFVHCASVLVSRLVVVVPLLWLQNAIDLLESYNSSLSLQKSVLQQQNAVGPKGI